MAKTLTIGSESFLYPEQGTKPGWGEEATCWAVAVTNLLGTLSGPNDINTTCVAIANNQCTAANVGTGASALSFSNAAVRGFEVVYAVTRTDPCCAVVSEYGTMEGNYNGTSWSFAHEHVGCAGMCFQITAAGAVQYFSDACGGAGTIKFRARTTDQ
jgi:hypothetical protein